MAQGVKGVTNNPTGRPRITKDLRLAYRECREKTVYSLIKIGKFNFIELSRLTNDPECKSIDAVIARMYMKAIEGSLPHAKELLDRILGTVTQTILLGEATDDGLKNISADHILEMITKLKTEEGTEQCKLMPTP